jgi:hypothetical protein
MKGNRSVVGYILVILSAAIVWYYNCQRAGVHTISAWDAIPQLIMRVVLYGTVFVTGLAGILMIYSSGDAKRLIVLIAYLAGIAGAFLYLYVKTKENTTPAHLSAKGPSVWLVLRKDSSYRIVNYAYHMGESWQEGSYSLRGNKITLSCDEAIEAGLDNELWIRRDTIFYGNAGSDTTRVHNGLYLAIQK